MPFIKLDVNSEADRFVKDEGRFLRTPSLSPPHQLATLVSELRRLDEESILMEAKDLNTHGDFFPNLFPFFRGSRKNPDSATGGPTSTSFVTRLPLEVIIRIYCCLYQHDEV